MANAPSFDGAYASWPLFFVFRINLSLMLATVVTIPNVAHLVVVVVINVIAALPSPISSVLATVMRKFGDVYLDIVFRHYMFMRCMQP